MVLMKMNLSIFFNDVELKKFSCKHFMKSQSESKDLTLSVDTLSGTLWKDFQLLPVSN